MASIDLNDFIRYEYVNAVKTRIEDEYREGYKVVFTPYLGTTARSDVSIDLVVDNVICDKPERFNPVGRLEIESLENFDYLLYPVINSMADKICATTQHYEGQSSSRIKDLVDLAVYLSTESFEASALRKQVVIETAIRKMRPIKQFIIPESWVTTDHARFRKLASETKLSEEYRDINKTYDLVAKCIDEALAGHVENMSWNCVSLKWE